ncbi:YqaJ viral recombinase family protein [Humibacter sp. RRB41]|uniref:YqaJ viral recombinase family protein n=1 Tax=Humibacter sp. RRB41 TaxID=2919946 RepID=UPI001FAA45E7|nr:YqaJ viral recombinase family protein [Humibacter sp. RRB41]
MTDVSVPAVLAELESRAGASDTDRLAWLAERRRGITATEVRDLVIGAKSMQPLINEKLSDEPTPDLSHVPVIGWGRTREPVIAERLRGEGFEPESRVFRHPSNARHLASPDGIRLDFDEQLQVSEIKTCWEDLPPGSPHMAKKGYAIQCQWVMYVIGATGCRFVVEERIELPDGSFTAGELHRYWLQRDDFLIDDLVAKADEFLEELDRQRSDGKPDVDEELDTFAVDVLRFREAESDAKKAKEQAWSALTSRMGEKPFSQKSSMAQVSWTPGDDADVEEPDVQAAKDADPELFAEVQSLSKRWNEHQALFKRTVTKSKPGRLTVTGVKGATK